MAQTKPFQWYQYEQPVGIPGMKADATEDVVDSFCAETALDPGDPVIRGTDGTAQVKPIAEASDGSNVIGIAVHTQKDYDGSGKYYQQGESVPVMTFGDVFVKVGDTVTAGAGVAVKAAASGLALTIPSAASAVAISGMTYLGDGVSGDIVPVRIRK